MRICPTCGNHFADDLSFCLHDGARLSGSFEHTDHPTAILYPDTIRQNDISTAETIVSGTNAITPPPAIYQMSAVEPSSRLGCVLTFGKVAACLLFVVGLGFAGLFYSLRDKTNEVARIEPPIANKPGDPNRIPTTRSANIASNTGGGPKATPAKTLNDKAKVMPKPEYPTAARAVRASGTVIVEVMIDEKGQVISATAISGHPLLRKAAEHAAMSAKFEPNVEDGKPVKSSGTLSYDFPTPEPVANRPQ
ncbi:hypothetical protein BH10ACI3_BH10ACI3_12790 [soil metagenome]